LPRSRCCSWSPLLHGAHHADGTGPLGPDGSRCSRCRRAARTASIRFPQADSDGYPAAGEARGAAARGRSLAPAGASVKDGLLAAYYGETRRRPRIDFYDTAGTPTGAIAAYDKRWPEARSWCSAR
jgi:hypothetical protein